MKMRREESDEGRESGGLRSRPTTRRRRQRDEMLAIKMSEAARCSRRDTAAAAERQGAKLAWVTRSERGSTMGHLRREARRPRRGLTEALGGCQAERSSTRSSNSGWLWQWWQQKRSRVGAR
jgi:hypothetical protein